MRLLRIALTILTTSMLADAAPAVHTFRVWGLKSETQKLTYDEKLEMYIGWSNGYFSGRGEQAFPEKWSSDLSGGIVQALTVIGGPCSGKAPKIDQPLHP